MGMPMEEQARKRMNVTVEYDSQPVGRLHGQGHAIRREQRTFPTMHAAKRFYEQCHRNGLNPKVTKAVP